jgi:hypothetical protein
MEKDDAADVRAVEPVFVVIETERFRTVATPPSKAQLLCQIRALQIKRFVVSQCFTN